MLLEFLIVLRHGRIKEAGPHDVATYVNVAERAAVGIVGLQLWKALGRQVLVEQPVQRIDDGLVARGALGRGVERPLLRAEQSKALATMRGYSPDTSPSLTSRLSSGAMAASRQSRRSDQASGSSSSQITE